MLKRLIIMLLMLCLATTPLFARDFRILKLKKFLESYPYSPLRGHEHEIVQCADRFGIDYRLYVAIAGAESTFGKRYPKQNKNLTGYKNGGTRFASIYQNIYETSKLIGTKHYYRKYRATKDIRDLVYVYKYVPPFEHYIANLRYVFDTISAISVQKEKQVDLVLQAATPAFSVENISKTRGANQAQKSFFSWNSIRYDRITPSRDDG